MHAPMQVGATVVDAPPGTPGGTVPRRLTDDRTVLAAVRSGDVDAFGALYDRHAAAVRRLARRMAHDRHEADDIVSEVFANTLRAIRNGRGPRDDAQAYLLRSVRHTAGKLRSRKDTGRSEPVPTDRLDRAIDHDIHLRSDIEIALTNLPDRHRDVLWATCVEGRPASEVAAADGLDTSCVTSLALRARRALGRSYLLQRTARPEPTDQCRRMRTSMPGCLRDEVSTSTATAVYEHIDGCKSCREVYDEMNDLDRHLCSVTVVGLAIAVIRGWLRFGGPLATTVTKPLASIVVAGAMVTGTIAIDPPTHDADTTQDDRSGSGVPWTVAQRLAGATGAILVAARSRQDLGAAAANSTDSVTTASGPATLTPAVQPDEVVRGGAAFDASTGRHVLDPRELTDGTPTGSASTDPMPIFDLPTADDLIGTVVDDVVNDTTDLSQQVLTGVTTTATATLATVTDVADGLLGGTLVGDTTAAIDETLGRVSTGATELVATVGELAVDTMDDLTDEVGAITQPVDALVDDVTATVEEDVLDPLPLPGGAPGDLVDATGDLLDDLVDDGIDETLDDTVDDLLGPLGDDLSLFGN